MKRAVEVRLLACMLEQKYDAVGSLRTITPQSAKRIAAGIVNSGKAKALDKMPAQFVHIAVDHGTVTLPTEFPMMKMDVQRNNDGEWVCPILSSQVQIELARKTSGR